MAVQTPIDWNKYLAGEPILGAQNLQIASQLSNQLAPIDESRRAALIGYGGVPAGYTGVGSDALTRGLADQATQGGLSTLAQLSRAYELQKSGDVANVAARGIVRSGATGQHLLQDQYNYNLQRTNALNTLMGQLGGFTQQENAARATAFGQQSDAVQAALDRITKLIAAGVIADPTKQAGAGGAGAAAPTNANPGAAQNTLRTGTYTGVEPTAGTRFAPQPTYPAGTQYVNQGGRIAYPRPNPRSYGQPIPGSNQTAVPALPVAKAADFSIVPGRGRALL